MMGEGTVNDEELVEVMAIGMAPAKFWPLINDVGKNQLRKNADHALAALRSAGFQVFRSNQAIWATVTDHKETIRDTTFWEIATKGPDGELPIYEQYLLIPAELPPDRSHE